MLCYTYKHTRLQFRVNFVCGRGVGRGSLYQSWISLWLSSLSALLVHTLNSIRLQKHTHTQPLTAVDYLTRGKLVWSTGSHMGWVFPLSCSLPKPLSAHCVCSCVWEHTCNSASCEAWLCSSLTTTHSWRVCQKRNQAFPPAVLWQTV